MDAINESLFLLINANEASPAWIVALAKFSADYLLLLIPLMLLFMWLWGKQREAATYAFLAILIALGLGQVIGLFYLHPRPFMIPLGHTLMAHGADPSFPSDHGLLFFRWV